MKTYCRDAIDGVSTNWETFHTKGDKNMQNKKVAIIDEDKEILGKLGEILSLSGYTPVPVIDPLLAIDSIIQNKPDVILLELKMPRRNGFVLTSTINRVFESNKVPIIAMSDTYKDEFRWLLNFCGIKRWIKKPFQPLNLIWAIENEIVEVFQWDVKKRLRGMEILA